MRAAEIFAVICRETLRRKIDFSDQDARIEFVNYAPQFGDYVMNFGLIGVVQRQNFLMRRLAVAIFWIDRIVAELRVLDQVPDDVDAEAVYAPSKPETHDLMDSLAHGRIAPIQIGLLGEKGVVIILAGEGVVSPAAAAK